MKKNQNKNIAIFAFSLLALIGTYNAVMINSESTLSDARNVKHLDSIYETVGASRSLAVATDWRKVSKSELVAATASVKEVSSAPAVEETAAISEALEMKLVEVINAKKWAAGVSSDKFNGSIATNNGVIESLVANLPGNMNIEISFSEMTGNTFEYDLNGEIYSGMMYQVDQSAYMVTMNNGPLEGTRLRFAGENKDSELQKEQTENYLAETHNVEVQNFGAEVDAPEVQVSESAPVQAPEASSFNFNI